MKIYSPEEQLKQCAKNKHIFVEFFRDDGFLRRIQYIERWWTIVPKTKVELRLISTKCVICQVCDRRFEVDYKLKPLKDVK